MLFASAGGPYLSGLTHAPLLSSIDDRIFPCIAIWIRKATHNKTTVAARLVATNPVRFFHEFMSYWIELSARNICSTLSNGV